MTDVLPNFKYHPNPVATGVINAGQTQCPVCNRQRSYVYEGPFYSREEVAGICPWCIHDGSAARKYHGCFQDGASCEPVDKAEYLDELVHRTPGYCGFQQEVWLSHCGDFCAYVGYAKRRDIEPLMDELENDVQRTKRDYRLSDEDFLKAVDGALCAYLFKCIHCDQHRVAFDSD